MQYTLKNKQQGFPSWNPSQWPLVGAINVLLVIFGFILLVTLKGALFHNLAHYTVLFHLEKLNNLFSEFYKTYLFHEIPFGNNSCLFCFEVIDRFPFDNIIFKFVSVMTIILLALKYRSFSYKINTSTETFSFVLSLVLIASFCYAFSLDPRFYELFGLTHKFTHVIQWLIFSIFVLTFFILFPTIMILIWGDTRLGFFTKIVFMILVYLFFIELIINCVLFLYMSGDATGVNEGINYIAAVYNFPIAEKNK